MTIAKGSGDPNAESTIRLRGVISLQGGSTPLVLVDGIEGGLGTVSPENIASIDVLKDASAAAIYGTRGANGVILITTKNGQRESRTAANYSGYMSLSKFGKTLDFYGAEEIRQGLTNYADKGYDTDWLDAVSRTAFTHNHNFNISGGSKNTTYSADFTYRKEEGVLLETYNEEMRMRFDVSHWMLNDMLKVNFNMVKTFHKNGPIDAAGLGIYRQAIMRNPTEPIWNEDGTFYENFAVNYYYNPVGIIREQDGKYNSENTRMTGNITFEPIKNWQTNLMLSRRVTSDHNRGYYTSEYFSQKSENHTGYAYHSQNEYTTDNLEVTSKYNHTWNKHRFDALVGYNYQYNVNEGFGANNYDYPTDFYLWNNLGLGTALKDGKAGMSSYKNDNTLIGFFGRVSYGYDNKYNVLLSVRREGSSKFGANQKWGYFPAASLAWEMMEMGFMKNTRKVLTSLKPRVSFGITGRSDFDAYKSLSTYNTNGSYLFDGRWVTGYAPSSNANPDLAWEKSVAINLGVDFVLWNRLRGSVEYFDRSSKDLLYTYTAPQPPFVYSTILVNVGTTKNTGIEVSLDGDILTKTAVKWTSGINYSYGKTKLTKLSNDIYKASYLDLYLKPGTGSSEYFFRVQEGGEIWQFYGYEYAGVDENGNMLILNDKDEQIPISQADAKYKRYIGNGAPKHFLSWSNNLTWRNFDLSVFFRGTFGFDVFNMRKYGMGLQGCGTDNVLRSAYLEDKNIRTGGGVISSYFLEDGSFIKLENVTLGYNFTPKNRKLLDNMRIYLSAKNLFTLTGYSGNDPSIIDVNGIQPGVDSNSAYPTATQLSLGVTLRFK